MYEVTPTNSATLKFDNALQLNETRILLDQSINTSITNIQDYCNVLMAVFSAFPQVRTLELPMHSSEDIHVEAISQGLVKSANRANHVECDKALFFQHPFTGLVPPHIPHWPVHYEVTNGIGHPVREPNRPGIIYKRYIVAVNKTLSFQSLSLEAHLSLFHSWMNQARVSKFWELSGDLDFHE